MVPVIAGLLQHAPVGRSAICHPPDIAAARRNIVTALLQLGLFDAEAGHSPSDCLLQEVELMLQVRLHTLRFCSS